MNSNKGSWKLSKKEKDGLLRLYESGMSLPKIAKKYGITDSSIHILLKKAGYEPRPNDEAKRTCTLDQTVFNKITEESAYWVGFLMADGCVTSKKWNNPILSLAVAKQDLSHLKKFKKFLKSSHTLSTFRRGNAYNLKINSTKLCADLGKYGITKRKTLTAKVLLLEKNKDFWRGVFDGDGSISIQKDKYCKHKKVHITLCGSKDIVTQFLKFIHSNQIITNVKIFKMKSIYALSISSNVAKRVLHLMYENSTIYLDRKYKKYKEAINLLTEKKGDMYWLKS